MLLSYKKATHKIIFSNLGKFHCSGFHETYASLTKKRTIFMRIKGTIFIAGRSNILPVVGQL